MISVGLTGGIGSGKSWIAKLFALLNIPVYNSDYMAKFLMENDLSLRNQVIGLLGMESYYENKLNKEFIANKIFSDNNLKTSLNNIVHEVVLQNYIDWKNTQPDGPYVIQEAAILFETGHYKKHDFMITVSCPVDERVNQLLKLGMKPADISQRMENQWTDEERARLSDYIIVNDEKTPIIHQVLEIHKILTK